MDLQKDDCLSEVWKDDIFAGKVVFCTGGAGTICSVQVRAMVYLGANACITGRNEEKTKAMALDIAKARKGATVLPLIVDVRSAGDMTAVAERCKKELGSIDFVIAGAAGNFLASVEQLSANAFKSVMDIDVLGSYNTVKATLPYLQESAAKHRNVTSTRPNPAGTGGRIIFVSATLHYTGKPMQAHVMAAKAAVDALSSSITIEQGPRGITSNVIAPGGIAGTEGIDRLSKSKKGTLENKLIPSGRLGTVKDIADATIYLFSSAGSYVNGDVLVVDGGAWRIPQSQSGLGLEYPDFLLDQTVISGVKGMKQSKM